MKSIKMNRLLFFILFSVLFLFTCKSSTKSEPLIEDYFILAENTKQITDDDFSNNFVSFLDDTSIITFKKALDDIYSFSPGEIIISTKGEGLLKKVDIVQEDGDQTILHVSDATIEEAFKECHAEFNQNLAPLLQKGPYDLADGVRIVPKAGSLLNPDPAITFTIDIVLYDFDSDKDNDEIKLVGNLSLDGSISGILDIDNFNINELYLEWNLHQHLDLNLEIPLGAIQNGMDDEFKKSLGSIPFGTFTLGALPITISPVLELKAGLSFTIQSLLTTGIVEDFESTTILHYTGNNQWDVDFDCTPSLDFNVPTVETSVEAEAYIKADLLFKVYQSLSPYVYAKLFDKFEANVAETPWWKLYAGFDSGVGIKLKIWSATLFDFSKDLYGHEWLIAQANDSQDNINILSPTSTTIWYFDEDEVSIAWSKGETTGNVKIELFKGDDYNQIITSSTDNDGNYTWDVPSSMVIGNDYKVKITALNDPTKYDYSPKFEIKSPYSNLPPYCPNSPYPINYSDEQSIHTTLSWECSDPDGDPLRFDVYFGQSENPPKVNSNQNNYDYYPGPLNYNTEYFWKVVAKDDNGESITCYDWNFTTGGESDNGFVWCYVNPSNYGYTFGENADTLHIVYPYEIMQYEVTNAQYTAFLNNAYENGSITVSANTIWVDGYYEGDEQWGAGNYHLYKIRGDNSRISFNGNYFYCQNNYEKHPVVNVTYFGAYAFTDFYGIALPTEYEWEKAARGHHGLNYPWGNSINGNYANFVNSGDPWDNGTTPIGYYDGIDGMNNNASPYHCYDMAGNVDEWCSSFYHYSDAHYVSRGGSWNSDPEFLKTYVRQRSGPEWPSKSIGFRCVKGTPTGNQVPLEPFNPQPPDNSNNQPIDIDISWECSDPNGDPLTFDIYFGTDPNPSLVATGVSTFNFDPGELVGDNTYYWKIIVYDGNGGITISPIWSFTTIYIPNNIPIEPFNPFPEDNSTGNSINVDLGWECSDPDGDPLTYDIYFGTTNTPPLVASNVSITSYDPGTLNEYTGYYWRIYARDNKGGLHAGPTWNFSTGASSGTNNFEWIDVQAGPFTFGRYDEQRSIDYDYQIMKYEVTKKQFAIFLTEALQQGLMDGNLNGYYTGDDHFPPGDYAYYSERTDTYSPYCIHHIRYDIQNQLFYVEEGYENYPVVMMTYMGAHAFANYYGFSIPNEEEWEKAARNNTGGDYPWGDELPTCDQANTEGCYEDIVIEVGLTTGISPYGVYDMAGNAKEFVDEFDEHVAQNRGRRTKGGSCDDSASGAPIDYVMSWNFHLSKADEGDPQTGFRCVKY